MAVLTRVEPEPTASTPRILHAVVEGKVQRSGRMELRRRLLKAIGEGCDSVSWELRESRLLSPRFYPGADLVFPSSEEESQETHDGARILFDLWTRDVRYLGGLPPKSGQGSGTFSFEIEGQYIPVYVSSKNTGEAERVDLHWDEVSARVQLAAKRALQWHEEYRLGHCPVSPFADAPLQPSKRRNAFWGILPAILVTAFSILATAAAFLTFAWPAVLGSVLWGLVGVPVIGCFSLNWLTSATDPPEERRDTPTIDESGQRAWTLGLFVFGGLFVSLLLLPAIVAGLWFREPEAVNLVMGTIFGFMMFLWVGLVFHHARPEPDLEPL